MHADRRQHGDLRGRFRDTEVGRSDEKIGSFVRSIRRAVGDEQPFTESRHRLGIPLPATFDEDLNGSVVVAARVVLCSFRDLR
jgi:hypothetical protein